MLVPLYIGILIKLSVLNDKLKTLDHVRPGAHMSVDGYVKKR